MSEHYPRVRIYAKNGYLLVREGLSINFYMRHSHAMVAQAVMRSLETYRRAVGPQALSLYASESGEWEPLDDAGWAQTRRELLDHRVALVTLADTAASGNQYRFEYHGKWLEDPSWVRFPGVVCAVSFWLPTEYLEEHGPARVRELALELAAPLPLCSGQAGLSLNCELDLLGVDRAIEPERRRYPGFDIPELGRLSWNIGTRVRGPAWLTFLGQPVLGEAGGPSGLRARLHSPETTVQELEGDRAVITLGPWPEAGDTEHGDTLPAYRELARVLEPWMFFKEPYPNSPERSEQTRRWERRFLD